MPSSPRIIYFGCQKVSILTENIYISNHNHDHNHNLQSSGFEYGRFGFCRITVILESQGVNTSKNLFTRTVTQEPALRPSNEHERCPKIIMLNNIHILDMINTLWPGSPCVSATPLCATQFHATWEEKLRLRKSNHFWCYWQFCIWCSVDKYKYFILVSITIPLTF